MPMRINKIKESIHRLLKVYHYFLVRSYEHSKKYFFAAFFNIIFEAVMPFIEVVFLPLIIDELMDGKDLKKIIFYLAGMLAGNLIVGFLAQLTVLQMDKYASDIDNYFIELMSERTMEMDFALTEDKAALDQLEKAKEGLDFAGAGWTISGLKRVIISIIQLIGALVVVAMTAPWALLISAFSITATTIINSKNNANEVKYYKKRASVNRAFNYSCGEIANIKYGKDIRLYNAFDMMMGNAGRYIRIISKYWREQADRRTKLVILDCFFGALSASVTYFYLGYLAVFGRITIGIFTQLLSLTTTIGNAMTGITHGMQRVLKLSNYAIEYVKFMEYPPILYKGTRIPENREHTFEFCNVSFQYPNTDIPVLQNVSLKIESGEHLSIVGLNGAGKTTFIKLLCRLYDVTKGEILLDGINIKDYDYEAYIRLFAPVFQDFKLFAFSARENIISREGAQGEEKDIMEVLKLCDISKKLESLPKGIHTPVFKVYEEDGIELSGGEQQKLAIARAVYRNSPVMVLDEPTAALDPVAEYEVYRKFHQIVGGKTAIYISHRLSSCRFCDRIAVFSDGTVMEYGTHEELCRLAGSLYGKMWAAQAKYYQ